MEEVVFGLDPLRLLADPRGHEGKVLQDLLGDSLLLSQVINVGLALVVKLVVCHCLTFSHVPPILLLIVNALKRDEVLSIIKEAPLSMGGYHLSIFSAGGDPVLKLESLLLH